MYKTRIRRTNRKILEEFKTIWRKNATQWNLLDLISSWRYFCKSRRIDPGSYQKYHRAKVSKSSWRRRFGRHQEVRQYIGSRNWKFPTKCITRSCIQSRDQLSSEYGRRRYTEQEWWRSRSRDLWLHRRVDEGSHHTRSTFHPPTIFDTLSRRSAGFLRSST